MKRTYIQKIILQFSLLNNFFGVESSQTTIIANQLNSHINLLEQLYNKQEQELSEKLTQLDFKKLQLEDDIKFSLEVFNGNLLTKHIQYCKASEILRIIFLDEEKKTSLQEYFKSLIFFLGEKDYQINEKFIFQNVNSYEQLRNQYPFLLNFINFVLDQNSHKVKLTRHYRLRLLELLELFSNPHNFTEIFQQHIFQHIPMMKIFSLMLNILHKSKNLAQLEYNILLKQNFHQQENFFNHIKHEKEKEKEKEKNKTKDLQYFSLFSLGNTNVYKIPQVSSYHALEHKSYEFQIELKTIKLKNHDISTKSIIHLNMPVFLGYDNQYSSGDCSFRAEDTTRFQLLDKILFLDAKTLSILFLFFMRKTIGYNSKISELMDYKYPLNRSNLNKELHSILLNYLSEKGFQEKLIQSIICKGFGSNAAEDITWDILTKSIEYLEKYYGIIITEADRQQLFKEKKEPLEHEKTILPFEEQSVEEKIETIKMTYFNPFDIINIDNKGNITFIDTAHLTMDILTFIKIINACFVFNLSYFPPILHTVQNNVFDSILMGSIDVSLGYLNKSSHEHSDRYFPLFLIDHNDN